MTRHERHFDSVLQSVASVEGHLSDCEIRRLLLLGSVPTSRGVVLEIGSFRGRSTIILAKAAALAGEARIVAVDPLTLPANSDPGLLGHTDGWNEFQANLRSASVESLVEFHREFSSDLAGKWPKERGIRLLWIDGDHSYPGAKLDFDLFRPFLADGAIVAMHDVLHSQGGPTRVFAEDVLLSPHFGAFGFSGSIGWAQYFIDPEVSIPFRVRKLGTYRRLANLVQRPINK